MNKVIEIAAFLSANIHVILVGIGVILAGIISALTALIALLMLIPGSHPQAQLQAAINFLQKIVDFIAKFSIGKKPE